MGIDLRSFLESKGAEYAPFDPNRAKNIFQTFRDFLSLQCYKIHVIGTNGKGSSGRYLALSLLQQKKKILHFTSPHLLDFNERFYKNGALISNEELKKAHEFLQQFPSVQEASYFEYMTFLALVLAQDVEFFIMEAGLGGEYDSTSCIESDLSIFTFIGIDHQEFLGQGLEEIATTKLNAMQKVAILAKQKSQIVGEIARKIAIKKNVKLIEINQEYEKKFQNVLEKIKVGFLQDNFLNAMVAMEFLGFKIPLEPVVLDLRGRFEQIASNVLIDVGHNEDAAYGLQKCLGNQKVVLVYNSYVQKNIEKILEILRKNILRIEILDVNHPRIIQKEELIKIFQKLEIPFCNFQNINTSENYLVFGSFSVVEAFLKGGYV
ncbi:Mur ligase family protein [Helicobacter anatolicus]|uniref:Mur ligase family protein n=1 Tax=Helicobacter anatolicus TaxID=2905874 RepID=UPI001E2CC437|nr:Mur ligase family protein [Helicobacter anatolicus]MCE3039316.1 bifunctional folylpolyglutamate synthase/dihydrofolate synthase [Helicobacter anatolicus]